MPRKTIIHVGMMKAASSWFQKALRQTKTASAYIPRDFAPSLDEIWFNRSGAVDSELPRKLVGQLQRFIDKGGDETVVVSNEAMLRARNGQTDYFDALERIADGFTRLSTPVAVLAFSRAPADWLPSIYQQFVKTNHVNRSFAQFVRARNGGVTGPLSFDRIERIFRDRLGPESFHWMPSEIFRRDHERGFAFIAEKTGLKLELRRPLRNDLNPSIDPVEIEAIRQLNRLKDCYLSSSQRDAETLREHRVEFNQAVRYFVRVSMQREGRRHPALRRILGGTPDYAVDKALLAHLEALGAGVVSGALYGPWRDLYRRSAAIG